MTEAKWKVGDMARYVTRSCVRKLILEVGEPEVRGRMYCCLSTTGEVSYTAERDLLTLEEWLAWWERFRDETVPREWRACAEAAGADFVPPAWWGDAVRRAMEPFTQ